MIDFQEVKKAVSIGQVAKDFLKLDVQDRGITLRSVCPACNTGDLRAILITPERSLFYCFASKTGGDQISLVAHVQGKTVRESAEALADAYLHKKAEEPKPVEKKHEQSTSSEPLSPLTYLDPSHQSVKDLGFPEDVATMVGIGHASKGMMRNMTAVPIRLPDGKLIGYIGVKGDIKVPPQWRTS